MIKILIILFIINVKPKSRSTAAPVIRLSIVNYLKVIGNLFLDKVDVTIILILIFIKLCNDLC